MTNSNIISTEETSVDHLLIGTPDLELGLEYAQGLFGSKPVIGGSHPGIGTRNALLGLKNNVYIEILAPDPNQSKDLALGQYLRSLKQPNFMWWAARSQNFELISQQLKLQNINIKSRGPWSRQLPDGKLLHWELLIPSSSEFQTALPFFINWHNMELHPSRNLPICGELKSFQISHPACGKLEEIIGSNFTMKRTSSKQLRAELDINGKTIVLKTPEKFPPGMGET